MARLIAISILLFAHAAARAMAVEYDLDKPLDSPQTWKYFRAPQFYVQYRCGKERISNIVARVSRFMQDRTGQNVEIDEKVALQIRLYANAVQYRRALRFSQYREGHFNARLNLVTSHCEVSAGTLAEQLNLYWLSDKALRKWQRIFVAEVLALTGRNASGAFADAAKDKPAPLLQVLLSNQTPGRAERAMLRQLTLFLIERKRLDEFLTLLIEPPTNDDTGLEVLEQLFPKEFPAILERFSETNRTLRKGQVK
jgi:hypothetical protein